MRRHIMVEDMHTFKNTQLYQSTDFPKLRYEAKNMPIPERCTTYSKHVQVRTMSLALLLWTLSLLNFFALPFRL